MRRALAAWLLVAACGGGKTRQPEDAGVAAVASPDASLAAPAPPATEPGDPASWAAQPPVVAGAPLPRLRVLVSGRRRIAGLAADRTHVYFTDEEAGTVARVARAGGALEILARDEVRPYAILVDGGGVTWSVRGRDTGALRRLPRGARAPVTLATGLADPVALAADERGVWVACRGTAAGRWLDGALVHVPRAGGRVAPRLAGLAEPVGVAVAGGDVAVLTAGDGSVRRGPRRGDAGMRVVASGLERPRALHADGERLVWVDEGDVDGAGRVVAAAPDGAPETLAAGLERPVDAAVAGETVVWLEDGPADTPPPHFAHLRVRRGARAAPVERVRRPQGVVALVVAEGTVLLASRDALYALPLEPVPAVVLRAGEVVALAHGQPRGVAVREGELLWALYEGAVLVAPLAGGPVRSLWHGPRGVSSFVAAGDVLAWAGWDEGAVWTVPGRGREPLRVAEGAGHPVAVALDASGQVWIARQDGGGVWRVPVSGGALETVVERAGHGRALALTPTRVVWLVQEEEEDGGRVALLAAPLAGGPVTTLVAETGDAQELATSGEDLYWLDDDPENVLPASRGRLWRLARGARAPELVASSLPSPASLVVAGGFAYMALADGSVARVPVGGGTLEPVAPGGHHVGGIAVGARELWVASGGTLEGKWQDGAVLRHRLD